MLSADLFLDSSFARLPNFVRGRVIPGSRVIFLGGGG